MLNSIVIEYKELRNDYIGLDNDNDNSDSKRVLGTYSLKYSSLISGKSSAQWKQLNRNKRIKYYRTRSLYKRILSNAIYNVAKVAKVFVNISRNNTHVTITVLDNNNIKRSIICSAGCIAGIKGTKRSTPLATEMVVKRSLYILKKVSKNARVLHLYISGAGRSRSIVRKAIMKSRMKIYIMREVTSIPHNGTRKESRRRV